MNDTILDGSHKTELHSNLLEIVRRKILETFSKSTKLNDIQMVELENKDDFVYGHWLSFILISGSCIKVMLKIHFNTVTTKKMLMAKMKKDMNSITDRVAMDFFREQCNLIAGGIKSSLNNSGIITGLSIPLVTRGFDEAIFSDTMDTSKLHDAWRLSWSDGTIVFSTVIEILKESDLEKINDEMKAIQQKELASKDSDDQDGEFL